MPSTSDKQARFMAMCAHNPKHAKGKCPPAKVAKEYSQGDMQRRAIAGEELAEGGKKDDEAAEGEA